MQGDGSDSFALLGKREKSIALKNQLQVVSFTNNGDGPGQGVNFVTQPPGTGNIIFGDTNGDVDLNFHSVLANFPVNAISFKSVKNFLIFPKTTDNLSPLAMFYSRLEQAT